MINYALRIRPNPKEKVLPATKQAALLACIVGKRWTLVLTQQATQCAPFSCGKFKMFQWGFCRLVYTRRNTEFMLKQ